MTFSAFTPVGPSGIVVNPTPSNQTGNGVKIRLTYGESITVGDALYFNSSGIAKKTIASNISSSGVPCFGLALETAATGSREILLQGTYKDTTKWTGGSALSVGGVCYLSESSNGGITQTQPSSTDNVIQVVGIAIASNIIYFNPSADYITAA